MTQENKTDCLTIHPEHDKVSSAILGALVKLGKAPKSNRQQQQKEQQQHQQQQQQQ
ncbi:hypothetical protein MFLAVUS_005766 [Mucor flavus]|uniref:Uncharacterized protein n=1 Tax=Mucor flavus TaxID=439312 RepID=A0ABP9YZQ3_9FUNG